MKKGTTKNVTQKTVSDKENSLDTFSDLSNKLWFVDGQNIKIGDKMSKLFSGDFETVKVKNILNDPSSKTWKIVISDDEKYYLIKSSKELK